MKIERYKADIGAFLKTSNGANGSDREGDSI